MTLPKTKQKLNIAYLSCAPNSSNGQPTHRTHTCPVHWYFSLTPHLTEHSLKIFLHSLFPSLVLLAYSPCIVLLCVNSLPHSPVFAHPGLFLAQLSCHFLLCTISDFPPRSSLPACTLTPAAHTASLPFLPIPHPHLPPVSRLGPGNWMGDCSHDLSPMPPDSE